jgi:hypothetical protein
MLFTHVLCQIKELLQLHRGNLLPTHPPPLSWPIFHLRYILLLAAPVPSPLKLTFDQQWYSYHLLLCSTHSI